MGSAHRSEGTTNDYQSGGCDTNSLADSKFVGLAPGVRVLRAADGFNNLGVPMGTDEWVEAELVRMVRAQDKRLKLIVASQ